MCKEKFRIVIRDSFIVGRSGFKTRPKSITESGSKTETAQPYPELRNNLMCHIQFGQFLNKT